VAKASQATVLMDEHLARCDAERIAK